MKKWLKSVLMVVTLSAVMTAGILLPHVWALPNTAASPIYTEVCPTCGEKKVHVVLTSHTETTHSLYKICSNSDCKAYNKPLVTTNEPHYGGTATCKDKAVCEGCKESYGALGEHSFTTKASDQKASDATCRKAATYYVQCDNCDAVSDTLTVEVGTTDPNKHEGFARAEFLRDEDKHWHVYSCCGASTDEEAHDYTYQPATCVNTATCRCGYVLGDALGHDYTNEDGSYNVYWDWSDYNTTTKTGSVWAEFTCTRTNCDDAGVPERCLATIQKTQTPGTCKEMEKNVYTASVEFDGRTHTDSVEKVGERDINNHTGGTEVRNAKEATCTEDGYTGDSYCKGCGKKLSAGTSIATLEHQFTHYVNNGDATCTEDGTKTAQCDHGCGATDTIPDCGSANCEWQFVAMEGTSCVYCGRCGKLDGKELLTEIQNDELPNGYHIIVRFGTLPKGKNAMFITVVDQEGDPVYYYGKWDIQIPIAELKEVLDIPTGQDYAFTLATVNTINGKSKQMAFELEDDMLKFNVDLNVGNTVVVALN